MMAILDSFIFQLDPTSRGVAEFSGLDTTEDFRYQTHKKIDAFDTFQDISKWGQKFSVKGDLILKKVHVIDPLAEMAKKKEPVVFAIADTGDVWLVIIKSIKRGRSVMDKGGLHFRQNFTVELEEVL